MVDGEDEGDLDSDEDEGEIGGSNIGDNSDAGSTTGNRPGGAQASAQDSSQFVSSANAGATGPEESKSLGEDDSLEGGDLSGGWDQGYLEDIFGAVDEIDYDDEVALEHLGEQEYAR